MNDRVEEITRRPLYVYDLPKDILDTLQRRDDSIEDVATPSDTESDSQPRSPTPGDDGSSAPGTKACSLCAITFSSVQDQRSHTRSDLHNYNLKQKLRGQKPVSEQEFETLVGDLDESLSGSDSSDSEDDTSSRKETTLTTLLRKQANLAIDDEAEDQPTSKRRQGAGNVPMYWFTTPALPDNTHLGIYRAIFSLQEREQELQIVDIVRQKQLSPKPPPKLPKNTLDGGVPLPEAYKGPHIFMCMIGGGHFAAMIVSLEPKQIKSSAPGPMVREATVLAHKTFHRYTTRRKQGGSQSANDNAKGNAHSAGAGIRRYNETALIEEVRQLLTDWKAMIDTSELLFVRATGTTNRRTLYGPYDDQVLRQNDPRIRSFPFNTRRATQKELMRSFIELTRVKVQTIDLAAIAAAKAASEAAATKQAAAKAKAAATPTPPQRSEAEETALLHTSQLQTLIRRSKIPALLSYLRNNGLSPNFTFYPSDTPQNHHAPTPLHLAAHLNAAPLILALLTKTSADPTLTNPEGKTPYDLASDRASRDAFRVARSQLGESAFTWSTTNIPSPLTTEEAAARAATDKTQQENEEKARRAAEQERLKEEGPVVNEATTLGKSQMRTRMAALGRVPKTGEERREEESRGLSAEGKMRLERERRARAAEERMRRFAGGEGR